MAGRWERTESALEELGHLLGNMEPLKDQVRTPLLNRLDEEAYGAGKQLGWEMSLKVLKEIAKGEGPFSRDPLTHCSNTVETMKAIAINAITEAKLLKAIEEEF